MIVNGKALKMRLELQRLGRQHQYVAQPVTLPLQPPTAFNMILEGYASTTDTDASRQKLRPFVFGFPLPRAAKSVPLLWKHDPAQAAGVIQDLAYENDGSLCIRAEVTHPLARRAPAFSIAARVLDYEIINAHTADYYALIKNAELIEVSLTTTPVSATALVHCSYRVSAAVDFLNLLSARVAKLRAFTQLMKENGHATGHG